LTNSSLKRGHLHLAAGIKHDRKGDFRNTKEPKHIFSSILDKVQLEPIHFIGICRNNIVILIAIFSQFPPHPQGQAISNN